MSHVTLESLGPKVAEKRGETNVRETAKEIGVSAATLSRIERGQLPDLETFRKLCEWLELNPGDVLGSSVPSSNAPSPKPLVHVQSEREVSPEAANDIAYMILAAQRALVYQSEQD